VGASRCQSPWQGCPPGRVNAQFRPTLVEKPHHPGRHYREARLGEGAAGAQLIENKRQQPSESSGSRHAQGFQQRVVCWSKARANNGITHCIAGTRVRFSVRIAFENWPTPAPPELGRGIWNPGAAINPIKADDMLIRTAPADGHCDAEKPFLAGLARSMAIVLRLRGQGECSSVGGSWSAPLAWTGNRSGFSGLS
jgi:hypothetical protein